MLFQRLRPPENATFYLLGVLFCALRFGIEFFRDGAIMIDSLTEAQWACLAGLAFFGYKLACAMRHERVTERVPVLSAARA